MPETGDQSIANRYVDEACFMREIYKTQPTFYRGSANLFSPQKVVDSSVLLHPINVLRSNIDE